jgi:hypothetical protein
VEAGQILCARAVSQAQAHTQSAQRVLLFCCCSGAVIKPRALLRFPRGTLLVPSSASYTRPQTTHRRPQSAEYLQCRCRCRIRIAKDEGFRETPRGCGCNATTPASDNHKVLRGELLRMPVTSPGPGGRQDARCKMQEDERLRLSEMRRRTTPQQGRSGRQGTESATEKRNGQAT